VKIIKQIIIKVLLWIRYSVSRVILMFNKFKLNIMSIDETIEKLEEGYSMVRFGDGEFMLMSGADIKNYQKTDEKLAEGLKKVLAAAEDNSKLLVCIPNTINSLQNCTDRSRMHWTIHLGKYLWCYKKYCTQNVVYGDMFVTRPYMTFKNRENCGRWFAQIRNLFENKEFVLIEGKYSRLGIGNDLFDKAKSVQRILCPPKNSYNRYKKILEEAKKISKDKIILLSVGPVGKLLSYDLFNEGYTVWDIGHIDSEYVWFLNQSQTKTVIANKHTAEGSNEGADIGECNDQEYLSSIIMEIE